MLFSFLSSVYALCNEQLCRQNQKTTGYGRYGHLDLKISSAYHIYLFSFWGVVGWNPLLLQIGFDPQISMIVIISV